MLQAQEDEADRDLLVDIGSSKCKPHSRFHANAASSTAPLARSRLAFPIDSPATCLQPPEHAQIIANRQSDSADKKQRHHQASSRAESPQHALAAMRKADSSPGPGFDIDICSPSNAAAFRDNPPHATSNCKQLSEEPIGAMMFDIDDDFGPAANIADAECSKHPCNDLGYAQVQSNSVQPAASPSPTQRSTHRGSSTIGQHLATGLQRHSMEPAVPASQHNALDIDIDDEACMGGNAMAGNAIGGSAVGRVPSASGMTQQQLQKPDLQSLHTSQGSQAEPQQQHTNQVGNV